MARASILQPRLRTTFFVTKLDPTGKTILYSTYIGGSVSDQTAGLALDAESDVYVTGTTQSPDFPTTPGALKAANPAIKQN